MALLAWWFPRRIWLVPHMEKVLHLSDNGSASSAQPKKEQKGVLVSTAGEANEDAGVAGEDGLDEGRRAGG